jgi:hypothetical protein
METDTTITNIAELTEFVKDLVISTSSIWWFRGHADEDWKLQPSVWRDFSKKQESYMTQEFLFKARPRTNSYPLNNEYSEWLALMQHYHLPTRLLDWSKSPLIALYFAAHDYHRHTNNISDKNACLWFLNPGELNRYYKHEKLIFPLNSKTVTKLARQAFYTDCDKDLGVMAASAIETNLRMLMQQSAFTIHSFTKPLEDVQESNKWLIKIKVPQSALSIIALELELMGIKLSNIYPDLDNLSTEIKNLHKKSINH